jgi:SNF2 family DNA or RNA helicase
MLRRLKRDIAADFEDPKKISFEEQLADGAARIPRSVRLGLEGRGSYELSLAQCRLIYAMIENFEEWAMNYNANLPHGQKPINLEKINPLTKLDLLNKAIYMPEYFGIPASDNPMWEALDRIVENRIARGEKLSLWAWNVKVLDQMQKRYASHGVVRIDGKTEGEKIKEAVDLFQNDDSKRILIANYRAGGVGITLTAAHCGVIVQPPGKYTLERQLRGRYERVIGLKNIQHAKEKVETEWVVPRYLKTFVEEIRDPEILEIFKRGTPTEIMLENTDREEEIFKLVMEEGLGTPQELEDYYKVSVLSTLGLL